MKIKENAVQEIDLLDLMKVLLKKWMLLIVAIIIGAILGGAFGVYRNTNTNKVITAQNAANAASAEEEDALDVPDVDGTYETYQARLDALAPMMSLADYEIHSINEALFMYTTMANVGRRIDEANVTLASSAKGEERKDIAEEMNYLINSYNGSRGTFTGMVNSWSDDQKSLFNEVVGLNIVDAPSVELVSKSGEVVETPLVPMTSGLAKMVIIGAFGIFVVAAGCITLLYVLSPAIKTRQEFEARYDCFCMGVVPADAKDKHYAVAKDLVETNLVAICKEKNLDCITVCSTLTTKDVENSAMDAIKETASKEGIKVEIITEILANETGLKSVLDKDQVVLFEKLCKSSCGSLDDVAKIFEKHQVDVLGAILA